MPYELIEKEYDCLTDSQQRIVGLFIRFLLSQGAEDEGYSKEFNGMAYSVAVHASPKVKKRTERKLGGFEKGFYMAPDFDKPLEDFAEYM